MRECRVIERKYVAQMGSIKKPAEKLDLRKLSKEEKKVAKQQKLERIAKEEGGKEKRTRS